MTQSEFENGQLEQILLRSYEVLKQPVAGEREAVLKRFAEAKASPRPSVRGFRLVRALVLAVAACLVVAVSARLLVVSPTRGVVYGFEASGQRLLEAQTLRLRGTRFEYDSDKAVAEPVRVPFEYLVKRPDKHSLTWVGTERGRGPMVVTHGTSQNDGEVSTTINDSKKQYSRRPIRSPLSARLSAESFAQGFLLSAALGPPEAPFRKIGEEKVDGRWLHLYEGRFEQSPWTHMTRLWFDPTCGHPVRLVRDEVLEDGSTRRDEEIDEIAVNVPLADELFRRPAPEGYEVLSSPAKKDAAPEAISTTPIASGSAMGAKLEVWYALRISEQAALVVWRRSAPKAADDGSLDWLANVDFKLDGSEQRTLRHSWVHQSRATDRWNWSLLAVTKGSLALRDDILLELHKEGSVCSQQMLVLRLNEEMLQEVVTASGQAMMPEGTARPSLAEMREMAKKLVEFGGK